jgi:acetone carboxylase gamma subunit
MRKRISASLFAENGQICCASCSAPLAPVNAGWKHKAALSMVSVGTLPGAGSNVESRLVLRQFSCERCGLLLDTETALPDDPFLEDLVKA